MVSEATGLISGSLVVYQTPTKLVETVVSCFLASPHAGELVVLDNSPLPLSHPLLCDPRVSYVHTGRNLGFGAGHNAAIARLRLRLPYHVLLNPDVDFTPDVLPALQACMDHDLTITAAMPRVQFPDGSPQRLCKLLPTPIDLILRRFIPLTSVRDALNRRYELHDLPQDRLIDVPSLSGCFLLMRRDVFDAIGGFDERYFMYMEDVDLVRRLGDHGRTVFEPGVAVRHAYAKGSYRDPKLLRYHLRSALRYFSKWGWAIDRVRLNRNRRILQTLARRDTPD